MKQHKKRKHINSVHPKKQAGKQNKTRQNRSVSHPFSLIPRAAINSCVVVQGSERVQKKFAEEMQNLTGSAPSTNFHVNLSPQSGRLNVDSANRCGVTESGSKLVCSPTNVFQVLHTTPSGNHKETISLHILRREQDYQSKQASELFTALFDKQIIMPQALTAMATNTSCINRPKRKTVRHEKSAVGASAKKLMINYLQNIGANIPLQQIEKENLNLCHLLSFAIFYHALDVSGCDFDTQVRGNLFVGSRIFNKNMMRIENVLLQLLTENAVREIHGVTLHSEFENSHVLSALTLEIKIVTHENRYIQFQFPFDVSDNRKMPTENTTAYYAFLKAIIDRSAKKPNQISLTQSNTLFSPKRRQRTEDNDQLETTVVDRQLCFS